MIFGATGLIGQHVLEFLLISPAYDKVVAFSRRPVDIENNKLTNHIINFEELEKNSHLIQGDDIYCCLGTTRRKAGSKAAQYRVDFSYSYEAAKIAAQNGVNQLLLVSSVGADPNSSFFYIKTKGELEVAVKALDFWAIHIFRPSVLLGQRNENRWGEQIAGRIGKFFDAITGGMLTKYKPIEADVVAKAMVGAAQKINKGIHIHSSAHLQEMAEKIDVVLYKR